MTEKKSNRPSAAATDVAEFVTDLESRQFVLRLGVLTGGDKPAINLRIVKQELHDEEMANEFADLARDALGSALPVLIGAYASR